MASQLVIRGTIVNLEENIEFAFNAGQIANLSLSQSNYTESFKIPRTSQDNVRLFEGLGIPSDISTLPYTINNVDVLQDYNIVYTGTLIVLRSDDMYYYCTVISGTRDIFQQLGDMTFSDITNVRNALPIKISNNVATRSIYSGNYTDVVFSIANYGGITHYSDSGTIYINVDCMAVSYHIIYLWTQIFNLLGIRYDLGSSADTANQYFTFPYPPLNDISAFGTQRFAGTIPQDYQNLPAANNPAAFDEWLSVSQNGFTEIGGPIRCDIPGLYNFTFSKFYCYGQGNVNGTNILFDIRIILKRNGVEFFRFNASRNDTNTDTFFANAVQQFNTNDILTVQAEKTVTVDSGAFWNFFVFDAPLRITEVQIGSESSKEILNFKLADYVKEFMYKYSLIGFRAQDGYMRFKSIGDIINSPTTVDWSDKFIRRIDESYDIGFNQHNYLKHQYVNEGANYFDGDITSNNLNAPFSRNMVESKVFVPSQTTQSFSLGGPSGSSNNVTVRGLQTYTAENNGSVKTEKRNFWNYITPWPISTAYFGSATLRDTSTVTGGNICISRDFSGAFNGNAWAPLNQLTFNTRYHVFELKLNSVDIMNLDQSVPYFFRQESAYYMLNELRYKEGEIATGKFTKINKG